LPYSRLKTDLTSKLVRIKVDGPTLEKWDATDAPSIWYKEKSRRVSATPRPSTSNASKLSASGDVHNEDHESEPFSMDEWKQWMKISIGDDVYDSDASLCDEEVYEEVLELDTEPEEKD